ncbi:MAG TPA: DUF3244 domain-containing protein [Leadbetterella sp.]|nr:DUF3244 domain-containing protein [Leadbetterella sp.]
MKKLVKTFALLLFTVSVSLANPKPQSFKVGMYNVQNSHSLKVFVEKQKGDNLRVELKDNKGSVIMTKYADKKSDKAAYCFDLAQLDSGAYQLEITNDKEVFVKDLNVVNTEKIEVEKKIIL